MGMLVLARKENEEIVIGAGLIRVVVIEIRGDKVRLGVDAPRELGVHRKEVQEAINAVKQGRIAETRDELDHRENQHPEIPEIPESPNPAAELRRPRPAWIFQTGDQRMGMLVLARKENEEIVIGAGLIRVVVIEIRGDKVRLGVDAPRELGVHRKEVQEAINAVKQGRIAETRDELDHRENQHPEIPESPNPAAELIYLAIPYTHPDPAVREARFELANAAAAALMAAGCLVFSPISHTHAMVKYGLPIEADFYRRFNEFYMSLSSRMIVLRADGWLASAGVQAEVAFMEAAGKPVEFVDPIEPKEIADESSNNATGHPA